MTFKPKFFYESGAGNEGGGGTTDTLEENKTGEENQQQQAPAADIPKPLLSDDELKNYGFDSPDALKTFLSNRKAQEQEAAITPEQKKEQENIDKANLLKFAAENKLLTVEDYTQYETVKSKSDKDIVFENFKKEFATENPEITDEAELDEAAKEEFNYQYKLNNTKDAEKAEKRFAREAKDLRGPIESKVTAAQEQFKENKSIRETYPKFENFVDESIKRNTPDKLAVVKIKDGEKEIPIEIELTKEDREAMAKSFKTPKTFSLFTTGKPDEINTAIDNKMDGWIKKNKTAAIAEASFKLGRGIGMINGSNVGANNPFPLINNRTAEVTGDETLDQSNARIAQERKKQVQNR